MTESVVEAASRNMLWCAHCRGLIPPRRDDDCFISCTGCGKVLLCQDVIASSKPTSVKRPRKESKSAGSFGKSISNDDSQTFKNNGLMSQQAVNANPAKTSAEAAHQMLLKKQAPGSKKKSKAAIIHDGDASGQNPLGIDHGSDMTEDDFKLIRQYYENVKVGRSRNQENVYDYCYDGDDDDDEDDY